MTLQILELRAASDQAQRDAAETAKGLEGQIERMEAAKQEDAKSEAAVLEEAYSRCSAIP